jgi:hypothetical protein
MFMTPWPHAKYRRIWRVLVASMLIFNSEIAHVGQLHIKKMELTDLIRRSSLIVIAEPTDPPMSEEKIVIRARGKKQLPPYIRQVQHFRVQASLRGDLAPNTVIAVRPANDALHERLHRDYYSKGLSRHVVVPLYAAKHPIADKAARILFLTVDDGHLAFSVGGGVEGMDLRKVIEQQLNTNTTVDPRLALVDAALRTHGDFGVYGDLRAGLAAITKECSVKLSDDAEGIYVDIVPDDHHGHEYQFVVTAQGTIEGLVVGESAPLIVSVPNNLLFEFASVRLVKQHNDITLTVLPVWNDAQRAPPAGFAQGQRSYRLSAMQFSELWREIDLVDFAHYAQLSDTDFSPTPPDMQHSEQLRYVLNDREVVQWSRAYQYLRPVLREPLVQLEHQLLALSVAHTPVTTAALQRLGLRDVQGLHGGQNVTVFHDGRVIVQVVTPTATALHERRFEMLLMQAQLAALQQLLIQHPVSQIQIPLRPGIPDQARPEITLALPDGSVFSVAKWDDERHPDFDALYSYLLEYVQRTSAMKPVWEGDYTYY